MKKLLLCLIACVLCAVSDRASAQTPAEWPPNPAKLFTGSVKVINTQRFNEQTWNVEQLDGRFYLREIGTGRQSKAIPAPDEFKLTGAFATTVPDPHWLLVQAQIQHETRSDWFFSAFIGYNIHNDQFNFLGYLYTDQNTRFLWATNTDFFLERRDMPEWSISRGYVGDLTTPNSFNNVIESVRFRNSYFADPPRLERWVTPSNDSDDSESETLAHLENDTTDCKRSVFDLKTHLLRTYYYGKLCITEYGDPYGIGYYRDISPDGKTASLVRYNVVSHKRQTLYKSNLERIFWVSSDERYAVLGLDDNDKIDLIPGDEYLDLGYPISHPITILTDLKTHKKIANIDNVIFYNLWLKGNYNPDTLVFAALSKNLLLLPQICFCSETPNIRRFALLSIPDGKSKSLRIEGFIDNHVTSDGRLLVWTASTKPYNKFAGLSIYDPLTEKSVPLTNPVEGYTIQIDKIEGNLLTLTVQISEEAQPSMSNFNLTPRTARYTIQLPPKS